MIDEIEKSKPLYSTDQSKIRISSFFILYCPNCQLALPLMNLYISHVKIDCSHCKKTAMILFSDYVTMMKKEYKSSHVCTFNSNHSGRISFTYCVNCGKWLCQECINVHEMNDSLSDHLRTAKEVFNNNPKSYRYYCNYCDTPIKQKQCKNEEHKAIDDFIKIKDDIKDQLKEERDSLVGKYKDQMTIELISMIIMNYEMFECLHLYEPINNLKRILGKGERKLTIGSFGKVGYGVYIYDNGDKYEGYWSNDRKNGKGKMTYKSGALYDGEWFIDMKSGYGVMIKADGSKYEGHWNNDKKNGRGKVTNSDGTSYEDDWTDDHRGTGFGFFSSNMDPEPFLSILKLTT